MTVNKRNHKNVRLLAWALMSCLVFSCATEERPVGPDDDGGGKAVTLALAPAGATRAPVDGNAEDDAIKELRVILFQKSEGTKQGTVAYNFFVDDWAAAAKPYKIELMTGTYDFAFIANEGTGATHTALTGYYGNKTLEDLYGEAFPSSDFATARNIPMTALFRNVQVKAEGVVNPGTGDIDTNSATWEIGLTRLGIRLDLTLHATPELAPRFTAVEFGNVPDKVFLYPEQYGTTTPVYYNANHEATNTRRLEKTSMTETGDDATGYTWTYDRLILPASVFQQEPRPGTADGDKAADAANAAKAVTLIAVIDEADRSQDLKGTIGVDEAGGDFTAPRNHWFLLDGTLKDYLVLTTNVLTWRTANQAGTVVDGENFLTVDRYDIELDRWEKPEEEVVIKTNVAGWEATVTEGGEWLSLKDAVGGKVAGAGDATDGEALSFSLTEYTHAVAGSVRTGKIQIKAGQMTYDLIVSQTDGYGEFLLRLTHSEMLFKGRNIDGSPLEAQRIGVKWGPTSYPYGMKLAYNEGNGVEIMAGHDIPLSSSDAGVDIYLESLAPDDPKVADNPFFERNSYLEFEVRNLGGTETIRKQVFIRQVYYSLLVSGMYDYYLRGNTYTFTLRSNCAWQAVVAGDDILEDIKPVSLQNTGSTTGQTFIFKIKDGAAPDARATVTFRSPDNLFEPQEYTIVAQDRLPNAYLLPKGGEADIPVRKAYRVWELDSDLYGGDGRTLPAGAKGAHVVWQDEPGLIESVGLSGQGRDDRITVKAAAGKQGNAVIAYTAGGEVYWSWHIWVTDYDPTVAAGQKTNNGYTLMDRHLGAMSATPGDAGTIGLYYQGGRKDPLPASATFSTVVRTIYDGSGQPLSGYEVETAPPDVNLGNAIQHPLTFYKGTYGNTNWYGLFTDLRTGLWENTRKTDYDPCPEGWRIAPQAAYNGFAAVEINNKGMDYGEAGFFPVYGLINYTNGTIGSVGSNLYLWYVLTSNTPRAFSYSASNPDGTSSRQSYGFPARCVRGEY